MTRLKKIESGLRDANVCFDSDDNGTQLLLRVWLEVHGRLILRYDLGCVHAESGFVKICNHFVVGSGLAIVVGVVIGSQAR